MKEAPVSYICEDRQSISFHHIRIATGQPGPVAFK